MPITQHNIYGPFDFSPSKQPRKRMPPEETVHEVYKLRNQLSYAELASVPTRAAYTRTLETDHFDLRRSADCQAVKARAIGRRTSTAEQSLPPPQLQSSISAPVLPQRSTDAAGSAESEYLPPWLREGRPREEPVVPPYQPRHISTRERTWRENLIAADAGRGPDPLAIHILRKHGQRFAPGGLASRTKLEGGFSTFAISNARLCTVTNGYCLVRQPIIPRY